MTHVDRRFTATRLEPQSSGTYALHSSRRDRLRRRSRSRRAIAAK